jgi:ubiquinone/menaquinone biosynthesis C-methylase UbiE
MPPATENTLTEHYSQYFATPQQLDWYKLMAVDKAANIVSICRDVPHDRIVDIGAGDGAVLNRLDELNFGTKLYALDISESGISATRSKTWKHLVECTLFDGYRVPYPDNAFDLAVLSHVIEHVEHPRMLLREAARVAKHVYIEVPLEFNRTNKRLRRTFKLDATGHINFYNPDLIRLLLESTGLHVLRLEVRHFTSRAYTLHRGKRGLINYWLKEMAFRFNKRFATTIFNYHCGLLCTKAE